MQNRGDCIEERPHQALLTQPRQAPGKGEELPSRTATALLSELGSFKRSTRCEGESVPSSSSSAAFGAGADTGGSDDCGTAAFSATAALLAVGGSGICKAGCETGTRTGTFLLQWPPDSARMLELLRQFCNPNAGVSGWLQCSSSRRRHTLLARTATSDPRTVHSILS